MSVEGGCRGLDRTFPYPVILSFLPVKDAFNLLGVQKNTPPALLSALEDKVCDIMGRVLREGESISQQVFFSGREIRQVMRDLSYTLDLRRDNLIAQKGVLLDGGDVRGRNNYYLAELASGIRESYSVIDEIRDFVGLKKDLLSQRALVGALCRICAVRDSQVFAYVHPRDSLPVSLELASFFSGLVLRPVDPSTQGYSSIRNQNPGIETFVVRRKKLVDFFLKECSLNVNALNRAGSTPFLSAIHSGDRGLVEFLLKEGGVDINWHGRLMLSQNPSVESLEVFKCLVDFGGDVNVRNEQGQTYLMIAAGQGNLGLVTHLLSYPAIESDLTGADGLSARGIAENRLASLRDRSQFSRVREAEIHRYEAIVALLSRR